MDPTKSKTTDATLGGVPPVSQVSSEPTSGIGTGVGANEPSTTGSLGGISSTPPEPTTVDPVTSAPPAPSSAKPASAGSVSAGTGMAMPEPDLTEPVTPPTEPTMPEMPGEDEEKPGTGSPSGLGGTL